MLTRLTALEQHEEDLRASLSPNNTETVRRDGIWVTVALTVACSLFQDHSKWVSSTHLAQLLSRIERKLAKHVGAEEFVQCNSNVLQKTVPLGAVGNSSTSTNGCPAIPSAPIGVQGPKKTCNLETYLDWSLKLKMLVGNDILQVGFASK